MMGGIRHYPPFVHHPQHPSPAHHTPFYRMLQKTVCITFVPKEHLIREVATCFKQCQQLRQTRNFNNQQLQNFIYLVNLLQKPFPCNNDRISKVSRSNLPYNPIPVLIFIVKFILINSIFKTNTLRYQLLCTNCYKTPHKVKEEEGDLPTSIIKVQAIGSL